MNHRTKAIARKIVDYALTPLVYPAGVVLRNVRRLGVENLPRCREALLRVGVFPLQRHYYEPRFDWEGSHKAFSEDRHLPGLDWNEAEQVALLSEMKCGAELHSTLRQRSGKREFYLDNQSFCSGDFEYWYQLVRQKKPQALIEIGSGLSTLVARRAIELNRREDFTYSCHHVCIEPYEAPWLEELGIDVIRKKVEDVDVSEFDMLHRNDILFIDSSHVIRPQGDVLFEYLNILPSLRPGVIVHIHDIFSPKDYPDYWLRTQVRFWNEQYLLEAFLCNNSEWKIIGALNFLRHRHFEDLKLVAPFLTPDREPGSFYIQKR